jgi:glycosyltransferase involved in cell wall biosynthesis
MTGTSSCLSVVVPVYNEAATVASVVSAVLAQPMIAELVVVDDGSNDETGELLNKLQTTHSRLIVHRHEV